VIRVNVLIVGCEGNLVEHKLGGALAKVAVRSGAGLTISGTDVVPKSKSKFAKLLEGSKKRTVAPVTYYQVDDPALTAAARSGRFDVVLVCTPPTSHAHYVRSLAPFCGRVLVEKPFCASANEAHSLVAWLEARDLENVFAIDHYRLRFGARWILQNLPNYPIGPIRSVRFKSLEDQDCWPTEVFRLGYSWEHPPHAWDLADLVLPDLASSPHRTWFGERRRAANAEPIIADTYFRCQQSFALPYGSVSIDVTAGKSMKADDKYWELRGTHGSMRWSWVGDEHVAITVDGQGKPEQVTPGPGDVTDPYEYLVESVVLGGQHSLLLRPRRAALLLEALEEARAQAGAITTYQKGWDGVGRTP
jgi:predicted dehydrogenase